LRLTINGEERLVPDGLTLATLVAHLSLTSERLAIERNRAVVRRADWEQTALEEGDRLEIIHFVGGGC
jgi:thiamine biosynthesis protein ThiS